MAVINRLKVEDLSPSTAITSKDQIRSEKYKGIYRSKTHNKLFKKNVHYLYGKVGGDQTIYLNRESQVNLPYQIFFQTLEIPKKANERYFKYNS